jgi:hypothetical protein
VSDKFSLVVRGRSIRVDANGLVSLTDIWSAAGFKVNQRPAQWWRLPSSVKLTAALMERLGLVGKSHKSKKITTSSVYYSSKASGTFAHPVLACAYAGYLNPKLEVEVREVWLRYRAGDAVLADEILSRASPEANEWAGVRAIGRATRTKYTSTLKTHGVEAPVDYAICTNETYIALFDLPAADLKRQKGLAKAENLRDSMDTKDLSFVAAAEALATERIEETDCRGTPQCKGATRSSARYIREAIERDRADRKPQGRLSL